MNRCCFERCFHQSFSPGKACLTAGSWNQRSCVAASWNVNCVMPPQPRAAKIVALASLHCRSMPDGTNKKTAAEIIIAQVEGSGTAAEGCD